MSDSSKKLVEKVKKHFKMVEAEADGFSRGINFDKDLSNKIRKVKEASTEVVKHIEERIDK